jgi:hypothetical protein
VVVEDIPVVDEDVGVVPFVGEEVPVVVLVLQALNSMQNNIAITNPADNHFFIFIPS